MRVALFLPHLGVTGGLGGHCRSLLAALLQTATPGDEFVVFTPADARQLFPYSGLDDTWRPLASDPRVTLVALPWPAGQTLARPLDPVLGGPVRAASPHLFYSSYYSGLADPPCAQAVTFHDAGFLDFPEIFGDAARQRREMLAAVAPKIDSLMCISDDARRRICRLLPFDESRTDVVWHGLADTPDELARAKGDSADAPLWPGGDRGGEWGRYFFSPVGAATGFNRVRKNLPVAVAAFRHLMESDPSPVRFVIAGTGALHPKMLGELLPESELSGGSVAGEAWQSRDGRVRVLPNLDRGPFLRAMARSVAVVYPSRYEGFGLPTIEGMALGVPVVAARATSIPEVAGDAALLVDPDSSAEFAAAMRLMLGGGAMRADLIARGERRAALFTLDAMGAATWRVWRRIADRT